MVPCLAVAYVRAETPALRTPASFSTILPRVRPSSSLDVAYTPVSPYATCPYLPASVRLQWRLITAIKIPFAISTPASPSSHSCYPGYWHPTAHELRLKFVMHTRQRSSAAATAHPLALGASSQGWRHGEAWATLDAEPLFGPSPHRLTDTWYLVRLTRHVHAASACLPLSPPPSIARSAQSAPAVLAVCVLVHACRLPVCAL